MEVDDIISYHDVVTAEKAALQKGMELWSRQEVFDLFDVVARGNAVRGRAR
jgi:hypothetical protein